MESVYARTLSFKGPSRTIGYSGLCVRELWDMSRCDCRRLPTWDCLKLRTFEEECTISRCTMNRSAVCEKFRRKEMEKLAEIMVIGHTVKHYSRLRVWRVCNLLHRGTLCRLTSITVCAGADSEGSRKAPK